MSRPPATPELQVDNERLRVTLWRFPPGGATGWHRHEHDYTVVPLTTGTLAIESADGRTESRLVAGGSYFRKAGVEHDVINANDYEFAFVEVELK